MVQFETIFEVKTQFNIHLIIINKIKFFDIKQLEKDIIEIKIVQATEVIHIFHEQIPLEGLRDRVRQSFNGFREGAHNVLSERGPREVCQ